MKPALLAVALFIVAMAIPVYAADPDVALERMRMLLAKYQSKEVIAQFAEEDFSQWPADAKSKAAEAFQLRGRAYMVLKDGRRAEADLQQALERMPGSAAIRILLGENYVRNLDDDAQALAAFAAARKITGAAKGWEPLSATLASVQILTDQLRADEALALLEPFGDLSDLAPIWRIKMLRAYGHIYASQGKEAAALAKFREALQIESAAKQP